LIVAALIAAAMMVVCRQVTLHGWYAPHSAYRAQVDAMLAGRLALDEHPEAILHDLTWSEGGVHQVWGLGVPLWQLPFEALGRAIGITPFPDRVAMLAWLALMLFAVIRGMRSRNGETRWTHLGAVMISCLFPPFITLLRSQLQVYEEAAVYAYAAAMILLGGTLAFARTPTTLRYLLLLAVAGASGLIRPTVWFYGLATAVIATAILWRARRRGALAVIALGIVAFVAGGGVLYATNAARFGAGSEFGHRLNVESLSGNIFATRFGYPFERAGLFEAATELVGGLFDRPELRRSSGTYTSKLHLGQSDKVRWREYYFTTYSWPYLIPIVLGLALGGVAWYRRRPRDERARWLTAWAVLGGGPIAVFYLRAPSISSRYQLDLAPAIVALLLVVWAACAVRWPRRASVVVIALIAVAITKSRRFRPRVASNPVDHEIAARSTERLVGASGEPHPLPDAYVLGDPLLPLVLEPSVTSLGWCRDGAGTLIDCAATPRLGDEVHRARWEYGPFTVSASHDLTPPAPNTEPARRWLVTRFRVEAEPICGPQAPVCAAAPTVADNPDLVAVGSFALPQTLFLNGFDWDPETGRVPPATLFYMTDPVLVAIDVAGPPDTEWSTAVRVMIGLEHLRLIGIAETSDGVRLQFAVREAHRGLQVAFVAFGLDTTIDRKRSDFILRAIRWR
jgi:hypothetical protein